MIDLKHKPVPSEDFCVRQLGEETIFLAASGDTIHSLDAVGTFVWQRITAGDSFAEILDRICAEYEVEREVAEADLKRFAQQLMEKQLIGLESGGA